MTENDAKDFVRARCTSQQFELLTKFVSLMIAESRSQNLIALASVAVIWSRHIADSAQLLDHVVEAQLKGRFADFGSGAGLPGIVLAILRPDNPVALIESRRLRVDWLSKMKEALALENVHVFNGDAGRITPFFADLITARAFAPLPKLLALCAPFSTPQTVWLLPKGRSAEHEVSQLPKSIRAMFHVEQSATDEKAGIIVGRGKVPVA